MKKIYILIIFILICLVTMFCIKHEGIVKALNNGEYKILVDVEESQLYLFENDKLIKIYRCSGGKWDTPSPIGTWKIVKKAKWGEGFGRKLDGT